MPKSKKFFFSSKQAPSFYFSVRCFCFSFPFFARCFSFDSLPRRSLRPLRGRGFIYPRHQGLVASGASAWSRLRSRLPSRDRACGGAGELYAAVGEEIIDREQVSDVAQARGKHAWCCTCLPRARCASRHARVLAPIDCFL